ncbi:MAG: ABC transporter permease [Saccharofermentanales bacterium]
MNIILSSISQGFLWAVMAIGVYIMYRILDIADLSAEGTFPLGAVVAARAIAAGVSPWLAIVLSLAAGMITGIIAGFLHTKMKIPGLLTGILILTGLYSINLRVLGAPNITLLGKETVISQLRTIIDDRNIAALILGITVTLIITLMLILFLKSELGLALRATGANEVMAVANAIATDSMKIIGYALSNGIIALAGALLAQNYGYADVGMGIGTIVIGLASIIIGERLLGTSSLSRSLLAVLFGAVIYRVVIDAVLYLGVNPQDIKLYSAIVLAIVLWLGHRTKDNNSRKGKSYVAQT